MCDKQIVDLVVLPTNPVPTFGPQLRFVNPTVNSIALGNQVLFNLYRVGNLTNISTTGTEILMPAAGSISFPGLVVGNFNSTVPFVYYYIVIEVNVVPQQYSRGRCRRWGVESLHLQFRFIQSRRCRTDRAFLDYLSFNINFKVKIYRYSLQYKVLYLI